MPPITALHVQFLLFLSTHRRYNPVIQKKAMPTLPLLLCALIITTTGYL